MYTIVDAINQQIPADLKPGPLLILTKFAELLPNPAKYKNAFRRRIGIDRFETMTHYAKGSGTIQTALKELEEKGYLVALEKREEKRKGNRPTLYELRLPEGYNEAIIDERRGKYYGGKPFCPEFSEDNEGLYTENGKNPRSLSPVSREEAEKLGDVDGKITPLNIGTSKEEKNNTGDVSVVIDKAVKLTGASKLKFKELNLTAETIPVFRDAMAAYEKVNRTGYHANQNAAYLIGTYNNMLSQKPSGAVQANPNALTSANFAQKAIEKGWTKIVEGLALGDVLTEDDKAAFACAMKTHAESKIPTFVSSFVKSIQSENGGSFEALKEKYPTSAACRELLMKAIEQEEK